MDKAGREIWRHVYCNYDVNAAVVRRRKGRSPLTGGAARYPFHHRRIVHRSEGLEMSRESEVGHWEQIAGAVRDRYAQITNEDLSRVKGNVQQLIGVIQEKTGESRERVEHFVQVAGERAASYANRLYDSSSDYAATAAAGLRQSYGQVSNSIGEGMESAKDSIQRRPMESVLTAFGVGVFAGVIAGLTFGSRRR